MGVYPPTLENLIRHLAKLPGIGQKSATRVALYILEHPKELGLITSNFSMSLKIPSSSARLVLTR